MIALGGALAFMVAAVIWYWPTPEFAFLSDNSPVSWLSSAQLWAIALLALRLGADRSLPVLASIWLGSAMIVLACDEQFMFHEHWKYGCHQWLSACSHRWVTEFPIIAVGVVGAATMVWLDRLLPNRLARSWLWSSLAVGGLAIIVDLFGWPTPLVRAEEALEVIAEALFAGTLLGLRAIPAPPNQVHSVM